MNLAHDLSHIIQRVATGDQNVTLGTIWTKLFFSSSHTYLLEYPFLHLRRLTNFCISLLYGICNFPAPSFPFDKTRLKDLSASSEPECFLADGVQRLKIPCSTADRCSIRTSNVSSATIWCPPTPQSKQCGLLFCALYQVR